MQRGHQIGGQADPLVVLRLRQRSGIAGTAIRRRQDTGVGIHDALHQGRRGGLRRCHRRAGQGRIDRLQLVASDTAHADGGIVGHHRRCVSGIVGIGIDLHLRLQRGVHQRLQLGQGIDAAAIIGRSNDGLGDRGLQGIVEIDHAQHAQLGLEVGGLVGRGAATQAAVIAGRQRTDGIAGDDQLADRGDVEQVARVLADQCRIDESLDVLVMGRSCADEGEVLQERLGMLHARSRCLAQNAAEGVGNVLQTGGLAHLPAIHGGSGQRGIEGVLVQFIVHTVDTQRAIVRQQRRSLCAVIGIRHDLGRGRQRPGGHLAHHGGRTQAGTVIGGAGDARQHHRQLCCRHRCRQAQLIQFVRAQRDLLPCPQSQHPGGHTGQRLQLVDAIHPRAGRRIQYLVEQVQGIAARSTGSREQGLQRLYADACIVVGCGKLLCIAGYAIGGGQDQVIGLHQGTQLLPGRDGLHADRLDGTVDAGQVGCRDLRGAVAGQQYALVVAQVRLGLRRTQRIDGIDALGIVEDGLQGTDLARDQRLDLGQGINLAHDAAVGAQLLRHAVEAGGHFGHVVVAGTGHAQTGKIVRLQRIGQRLSGRQCCLRRQALGGLGQVTDGGHRGNVGRRLAIDGTAEDAGPRHRQGWHHAQRCIVSCAWIGRQIAVARFAIGQGLYLVVNVDRILDLRNGIRRRLGQGLQGIVDALQLLRIVHADHPHGLEVGQCRCRVGGILAIHRGLGHRCIGGLDRGAHDGLQRQRIADLVRVGGGGYGIDDGGHIVLVDGRGHDAVQARAAVVVDQCGAGLRHGVVFRRLRARQRGLGGGQRGLLGRPAQGIGSIEYGLRHGDRRAGIVDGLFTAGQQHRVLDQAAAIDHEALRALAEIAGHIDLAQVDLRLPVTGDGVAIELQALTGLEAIPGIRLDVLGGTADRQQLQRAGIGSVA